VVQAMQIRSAKKQKVNRHQGRQANDTVREKQPDKRLFFTPFVLESTGYFHGDAVILLNLLAKRTAEIWKISETGVYQYLVSFPKNQCL
jgi:hypothetical protein